MLLAIVLFAPDGILGLLVRGRDWVLGRRGRASAAGRESAGGVGYREPEQAVLER
jgi:hypothetical protein